MLPPVVCPLRTGKLPLPLTGPDTVSLLLALGCLPPPLMQAYVAVPSAERVIFSVVVVLPSPASLKPVATRAPELLILSVPSVMKWGLPAKAARAPPHITTHPHTTH